MDKSSRRALPPNVIANHDAEALPTESTKPAGLQAAGDQADGQAANDDDAATPATEGGADK